MDSEVITSGCQEGVENLPIKFSGAGAILILPLIYLRLLVYLQDALQSYLSQMKEPPLHQGLLLTEPLASPCETQKG